ncbi:uncharacterized protein LOC114363486 [Ostrinia furnacalis]|uniref:uncharacterized protein LOC114363486 n=1 Tax=Ostrinia furnacalis TaxID=93504 RepID=UPI00103E83D5|nr:uncharacterized protein LOC114363486 [Ostrinia furnacalis]
MFLARYSSFFMQKAGEPGVVVLNPEALAAAASDEECECDGPPSPCAVRFVNDNVLINGRSSMPPRPNRDRIAKLKLQFDDSLTCTFEYPSETSLCEEPEDAAHAGQPTHASLTSNTHIVSAALARYTPHKTVADAFQLGVTRHSCAPAPEAVSNGNGSAADDEDAGDARPCQPASARSWSEARTLTTDLLF